MSDVPRLMRVDELAASGIDRPWRNGDGTGLRAVRRGIYVDGSTWDALPGDERAAQQVLAASRTLAAGRIFSHESAAALLGLPVPLLQRPDRIHVIDERRSGGRTQAGVVHHCLGLEHVRVVQVRGVSCTSPARTAFDIAVSRPFETAVVIADAVLARYPEAGPEFDSLLDAHRSRMERGPTSAQLRRRPVRLPG